MGYTIDDGIPLPHPRRKLESLHFAMSRLEIGQSIFVPNTGKPRLIHSQNVSAASGTLAKRRGVGKFATRTVTENGIEGCRVWRVE